MGFVKSTMNDAFLSEYTLVDCEYEL